MNEDFVSFDLAKKLKKKGFPQYTEKSYFVGDHKNRMCSVGTFLHVHTQNAEHLIAAPTISQVLKWLREEKKIFVEIVITPMGLYKPMIYDIEGFKNPYRDISPQINFNEAAIAGIEYVLDNSI